MLCWSIPFYLTSFFINVLHYIDLSKPQVHVYNYTHVHVYLLIVGCVPLSRFIHITNSGTQPITNKNIKHVLVVETVYMYMHGMIWVRLNSKISLPVYN